jgi:hypothetical protein
MRTIDIDEHPHVELWPGRRMLLLNGDDDPALISLPRSSMTIIHGSTRSQLAFGSATKSTVIVTGQKARIVKLASTIVGGERPEGAVLL